MGKCKMNKKDNPDLSACGHEEAENTSNFLLYTGSDGKVNIEVFLQDETVWLTQKAMAALFGVQTPAINKH